MTFQLADDTLLGSGYFKMGKVGYWSLGYIDIPVDFSDVTVAALSFISTLAYSLAQLEFQRRISF